MRRTQPTQRKKRPKLSRNPMLLTEQRDNFPALWKRLDKLKSKSSNPEPKMTLGKKSRKKKRAKCSKRKSKAGRPSGSKAPAPRAGSLAERIVKVWHSFPWKRTVDLMLHLNGAASFAQGEGVSQSVVCSALARWVPNWRATLESNKYGGRQEDV